MCLSVCARIVDVYNTGFQVLREVLRELEIAREHSRGEPKADFVGALDCFADARVNSGNSERKLCEILFGFQSNTTTSL